MTAPAASPLAQLLTALGVSERTTRCTAGRLLDVLADLPDTAPVLIAVPDLDYRAEHPVAAAHWDGALLLTTLRPVPQAEALFPAALFPALAAPANTTDRTDRTERADRAGECGLSVGELREVLAALPDYTAVLLDVHGWDGPAQLPVSGADWDGALTLSSPYLTWAPGSFDFLHQATA
ncbi:hypothetical protein [Streptomyces sp. NRRL B-24484]|uniref:hypothetical protein n=1 Tax=Streptomyces sp. NRRL B-24484 TaxID=1463833 RepID=UPI0004C172C6|nr:hypothetical protein [Streptomyces sp. NRRL B-24484]